MNRWLSSRCFPTRPADASSALPAVIGDQFIHESHAVRFFGHCETWACTWCGAIGRDVLRDLARPCDRRLSVKGARNLRRLETGLMPGRSPAALAFNATRRDRG